MIIRRNPDGSLVDEPQQSHPALTTRRGMSALSESGRAVPPLFSEIATKINNAKINCSYLAVDTRTSTERLEDPLMMGQAVSGGPRGNNVRQEKYLTITDPN